MVTCHIVAHFNVGHLPLSKASQLLPVGAISTISGSIGWDVYQTRVWHAQVLGCVQRSRVLTELRLKYVPHPVLS